MQNFSNQKTLLTEKKKANGMMEHAFSIRIKKGAILYKEL